MTLQDLPTANHPDFIGSLDAMQRAAESARQLAMQTDTAIVVMREGKIVRVTADELRREATLRAESDS